MSSTREDRAAVQQTLDVLYDISQLLNSGLDRDQLALCVSMIESGVNPDALAAGVLDLRREKASLDGQPRS